MSTVTDTRPAAGWAERPDGRITFTQHDARFVDEAPAREGFHPYFIARHGIGPGSYTTWTYKPDGR